MIDGHGGGGGGDDDDDDEEEEEEAHVDFIRFSFGFEIWTTLESFPGWPGRGVPQGRRSWSSSHSAAPYRGRRCRKVAAGP